MKTARGLWCFSRGPKMTTNGIKILFWCLIAVEAAGSQAILWNGIPIYRRLLSSGTEGAGLMSFVFLFDCSADHDFVAILFVMFAYKTQLSKLGDSIIEGQPKAAAKGSLNAGG
jgi:hypothetical protein